MSGTETEKEKLEYRPLSPEYDEKIAVLVRSSLKAHGLDIPGTAYYDEALGKLSAYYDKPGRAYDVLLKGSEAVGGIGLAEYEGFDDCCELQKFYLAASMQGRGLGYDMIRHIEEKARLLGYKRIYLETHTDLAAAIHLYEKLGYQRTAKPEHAVHNAMNYFCIKEL